MRLTVATLVLSLVGCMLSSDDHDSRRSGGGDACFVGGCSSQLCSDRDDLASTCEWREDYACYRTATCERQPTGDCGWTDTPELASCLAAH